MSDFQATNGHSVQVDYAYNISKFEASCEEFQRLSTTAKSFVKHAG